MLLLAILYGHPVTAPAVFQLIDGDTSGATDLTELLDRRCTVTPPPQPSTDTLSDHDAIPSPPPAHVAELHRRIQATLAAMGDAAPVDLAVHRYWLPRVARFSFRHRKLAARSRTPGVGR